jgi:pimeloyl-ACP methyl ester carboxylesterase
MGTDGYINPTVFRQVFCADVSATTATTMAASQRPAELATLGEPSGVPAWKTIPSWYLVANQDHAIPPATERFMAHRMGAHTVEIDSSHVAMISHPKAVRGHEKVPACGQV